MKNKIAFLVLIFICSVIFTSCALFGQHITKKEIFSIVNNNRELLEKLPEELERANLQSGNFSTTEKIPLPAKYKIHGLYEIAAGDMSDDNYISIKNVFLSKVLSIKGIERIDSYWDGNKQIKFECGGDGFGSATNYYGLYYTTDNQPVSDDAMEPEMKVSGNGWDQSDEWSDNSYYTERITDNWFYYEEHW